MRKIIGIVTMLCVCLFVTSCVQYKDTNGVDNYSLSNITHRTILRGNSYNTLGWIGTNVNAHMTVSAKKFNGVRTIGKVVANNDTITINYSSTVFEGNFGLFLVTSKEIIYEFPINIEGTISLELNTDTYSFRVAGEAARFEVECSYTK